MIPRLLDFFTSRWTLAQERTSWKAEIGRLREQGEKKDALIAVLRGEQARQSKLITRLNERIAAVEQDRQSIITAYNRLQPELEAAQTELAALKAAAHQAGTGETVEQPVEELDEYRSNPNGSSSLIQSQGPEPPPSPGQGDGAKKPRTRASRAKAAKEEQAG